MNNLDKQYQSLLQDILDNGYKKKDRTGTGTLSLFGKTIRHKMSDGFPLLTTKKLHFHGIVTELLWFLKGRTDIQYLQDNDVKIWNGDYEKSGRIDGQLGPIYGKQWRKWQKWLHIPDVHSLARGSVWIDQIRILVNTLKTNPDSRRMIVSSWNVAELDDMVLPPCHMMFQCYTRELKPRQRIEVAQKMGIILSKETKSSEEWDKECDKKNIPKRAISLKWTQRSVDTFLGLPYNIASYGLLLQLLANECNMVADELIGELGDTHLYSNHIEQAKEQISRTNFELPQLIYTPEYLKLKNNNFINNVDEYFIPEMFKLENYQSHPAIKADLSN